MQIQVRTKVNIDTKKVSRSITKSKVSSVAQATAYVWKSVRNSIRKRKGRQKRYDLHIYDQNNQPVEKVSRYLARPHRRGERVYLWTNPTLGRKAARGNVRELQTKAVMSIRKGSQPGGVPYSWPASTDYTGKRKNPGWPEYWLRDSIRFNPDEGTVYSSPLGMSRTLPMPQILEKEGNYVSNRRYMAGYKIIKRQFRNGSVHVTYKEHYESNRSKFRVAPRPFMAPAAQKAKSKLPDIFAKQIKLNFH